MTKEQLDRALKIQAELDNLSNHQDYLSIVKLDKRVTDCDVLFNCYDIDTMEYKSIVLECVDIEFAEKIRQLFQEYINSKMEQLTTEFEQL